jgi:hypothetical protein
MARLTNTILSPKEAYSAFSRAGAIDLGNEGSHGHSPDLRHWLSSQMYVQRPLVCVLLDPPKFIEYMPHKDKWYRAIKNLVETHPQSVEGFNASLKPEFDEAAFGGAGEMFQVVTDMKRARTEPVFTYREREGRPIQNLIGLWMQYGMMDPESKFALIRTIIGSDIDELTDYLNDWSTMTCMFYEPDVTNTRPDKCWITTNMQPMEQGEVTGKRDLTAAGETLTLSIPFTGISMYNSATLAYAQKYMDDLAVSIANPSLRSVWDSIASPNATEITDTGYKYNLDNTNVTPRP